MSTGISMSSVNKIKELADNGDYSLALDILEHQDLSKSLSPQFIRICGEVYYENKRYSEARAALVRAHSMAPAGNKIIYSIIRLYLSMGLWELAEKYYEIYRFNQTAKDAGTYRIEYMLAKAKRRPVNELYSILIAANDLDTDETWDFEMLLLHAYIRNREKYESACIEYKAKYKNSPHLYMLDRLMEEQDGLQSMIYCYPGETEDDSEEQAGTRENEKRILEDDELRMHPKDAKITIMVEDDAPVTSSMKFRQMWIRSKDKKEKKKAEKLAGSESEEEAAEAEAQKKPKGFFGRFAKKEEELVEKGFEELQNASPDKEQLLDEVLSKSDEEREALESVPENEHSDDAETTADAQSENMVELRSELTLEDTARYNEDTEEAEEEHYVIEEEPEEVFMVDFDMMDTGDEEDTGDAEPETEIFSDEFDDDGFDDDAELYSELESIRAEMTAEQEPEPDEEPVVMVEEPEAEYEETETVVEEPEAEYEETETVVVESEPEDAEPEAVIDEPETEDVEPEAVIDESESEDVEPAETDFSFDDAFESLDEFEIDTDMEDDTDDISEVDFEPDESETQEAEETEETTEAVPEVHTGGHDYPLFTSSLFPDYNTDSAGLYDLHEPVKPAVTAEEETKINENLRKEEALIGETDKLLASLGIKLD